MGLSTELQQALARARRRPQLRDRTVNQEAGAKAPLLQESLKEPFTRTPAVPPDRRRPQSRKLCLSSKQASLRAFGDDPNNDPDPDDCALSALPPPSPDWSHLLCGRPHKAASAISARMALASV